MDFIPPIAENGNIPTAPQAAESGRLANQQRIPKLGGEIQMLRSKGRAVAEYKPRPKMYTPEQLSVASPSSIVDV